MAPRRPEGKSNLSYLLLILGVLIALAAQQAGGVKRVLLAIEPDGFRKVAAVGSS